MLSSSLSSVFFFFLFLLLQFCDATAAGPNKITNLPGYKGPQLSMYTGYVTVNATSGRSIFYWLVESENKPTEAPLLLWFQGGPGCSGLFGLFNEHGPFVPDSNGGLVYNNLGWTQFANMLYLEQPAGVGFSYSNTSSDYNTNDDRAAADNLLFVLGFLEQFPVYKGRDLWLTGESYGGIYVPMLASLLLQSSVKPQFKGIMIGNPALNCDFSGVNALGIYFNSLYWHGLVSHRHYRNWTTNACDKADNNICEGIFQEAIQEIGVIDQQLMLQRSASRSINLLRYARGESIMVSGDRLLADPAQPSLDPDDLYQDFCTGNASLEFTKSVPNTCNGSIGDRTLTYLNRADVQKAIAAFPIKWKWAPCSSHISYKGLGHNMISLIQNFKQLSPNFHVLVYSGDIDILTVPFGLTAHCLSTLQAQRTRGWGGWYVNKYTAGYWETYSTHTYATVKGAGHEAPKYQPLNSFAMVQRFLKTQKLEVMEGEEDGGGAGLVVQGERKRMRSLRQSDLLPKNIW